MDQFNLAMFLTGLLSGSVRLAAPILLPALGEIYSQRSGIINLGLEGIMIMGALGGFVAAYLADNILIGVLGGILVGMFMSLIMAYLAVTIGANQVIAGFAITMIGGGLSVFLYRVIFGLRSLPPQVVPVPQWDIPFLSDMPVVGTILFKHSPFIYVAYLLVPLAWIVLYKTKFGLRIRAVGENPEAADTRGINVFGVRYTCVLIDGALAGLGGAYLSLAFQGSFVPDMTAGRGFIALAVAVLSRWNPLNAIWGSMLFGGAYALQLRLQTMNTSVPHQALLALPYVLTLIVLIGASRRAGVPGALARPYTREHQQ